MLLLGKTEFSTILLLSITYCVSPANSLIREYYVAIEEIEWDFAPFRTDSVDKLYVENSSNRVGTVYKKAVYREYTDSGFKKAASRPPWLGLFGPVLKGEVKDTILVHALNRASRKYSFHPHGVFYLKSSEGALYNDNSAGKDKEDDGIPPGGSHTYVWEVREEYGPAKEDPNCLTWAYHSHVDSTRDTNSGLVGILLTCRQGTLTSHGFRTDVDRDFAVVVTIMDENKSWYLDENIQTYARVPGIVDKDNEDFIESNKKYTINGRIAFNLPGLEMCHGDLVSWHVIGMGSVAHSFQFFGQTVIHNSHRRDLVTLFPASFVTVMMEADNPGTWMLACQVNNHFAGGMKVDMKILDSCRSNFILKKANVLQNSGNERIYYIAINEVEWKYGPNGTNGFSGRPLDADDQQSALFFKQGGDRIGGTYRKALYRGYTDHTFSKESIREPYYGYLGPLIMGEVGDTIKVVLKNNATRTYNIEPRGVLYESPINLRPGDTGTYIWSVPGGVSPTVKDEICISYLYSSTTDPVKDQQAGLVGPMIICKTGQLKNKLNRKTYYIMMHISDENLSHYLGENIINFASDPTSVDLDDEGFLESNRMMAINGYSYITVPIIDLCVGEETDFHVFSVGSELDVHSFILEGAITLYRSEYTSVVGIFPHTAATITYSPFAPGRDEYGCYVVQHGGGGIVGFYRAIQCSVEPTEWTPTFTRTFYIGVVEEIWDYLPLRKDHLGASVDNPEHYAYTETRQENGRFIGTKYKKAIYYEYTDDSFKNRKEKPDHLGFLGPILKMEVGDEVKIVFKNMASHPFSVYPLGVYVVGMMQGRFPSALPGQTLNYTWQIRPENGPRLSDPDCVGHTYTSFSHFIFDGYSGLNGPFLICRQGSLAESENGMVDESFHLFFSVVDENLSKYIDDNIRTFAEADPDTFDKGNPEFVQSNKMSQINGRMYNLPGLNMKRGDTVRWHISAMGEEDIHAVHFHANAFIHYSDKESHGDVLDLNQRQDTTLLMRPDAVGTWLMHCHVNDHATTGMVTTYTVRKARVVCRIECKYCLLVTHLDCSQLGIDNFLDLFNENGQIRSRNGSEIILLESSRVSYLDLSHNINLSEITSLKNILKFFPSLKTIKLNAINLQKLPSDLFTDNTKVEAVYVADNHIQELTSEFFRTNSLLKILDLHGNAVSRMPASHLLFVKPLKLRRIDLRGNALRPGCLNAVHIRRTIRCTGM